MARKQPPSNTRPNTSSSTRPNTRSNKKKSTPAPRKKSEPTAEKPKSTRKSTRKPARGTTSRKTRGIGLAGFDFQTLNQRYLDSPSPINDASNYGVTIQPAAVADGATYWQAVGIYHLTPEENRSRHNIFVDALDEGGQRAKEARVGWTWEGNNASPPINRLDKPDGEPGTDIPIFDGVFRLWIAGDEPTDTVSGIHYHHDDERTAADEIFNSKGHHSFYVLFRRTKKAAASGPTIDPGTTTDTKPAPDRIEPDVTPMAKWQGRITATLLNVRAGPSTAHPTVGSLPENGLVEITGQAHEWLQILWQGSTAFVHSDFVVRHNVLRPQPKIGIDTEQLTPPPGADSITISVANTWNRYRDLLERESTQLGIDPGAAVAILVAESKGEPFGPDGRMTIRFENHIFYERWGRQNQARFAQHFSFDPTETWKRHRWTPVAHSRWQQCHVNQAVEWSVFNFARTLNEEAAMKSISMGLPQVMGFNHANVGYTTVQQMFNAFQNSAEAQAASLFRFIETKRLASSVQQGDFRSFARVYNGTGQVDLHAGIVKRNLAAYHELTGASSRTRTFMAESAAPLHHSPIAEDTALAAAWSEQLQFGLANSKQLFEAMLTQIGKSVLNDGVITAQLGVILNSYWAQLAFDSSAESIQKAGAAAAAQIGAMLGQPANPDLISSGSISNGSISDIISPAVGGPSPKVTTDQGRPQRINTEGGFVPATATHGSDLGGPNVGIPKQAGRKRALCVGIDRYTHQPLSGCVADAQLWAQTLTALGFEEPLLLLNERATRNEIVNAITNLVATSQPGDVLVLQYAGHGTQLADVSGDEVDGITPEKDEALVPYDYLSGAYVIDDDLGAIFSTIPAGVNVTCFMDCCHSGSISRDVAKADERPRFIEADAAMLQAHSRYRQGLLQAQGQDQRQGQDQGQSRTLGKRDIESMQEVVFSACRSDEVAWESAGHGEFTLRVTSLIKDNPAMPSHQAFMDQINAAFGPSPRQHPLLECASDQLVHTLLEVREV